MSRLQFVRSGPHWTTTWERYKLQMLLGRLVLRAKLNSLHCPAFSTQHVPMTPANLQKAVKTRCKLTLSTPDVQFLTMQVLQITFFPICFPAFPPLSLLQMANTPLCQTLTSAFPLPVPLGALPTAVSSMNSRRCCDIIHLLSYQNLPG